MKTRNYADVLRKKVGNDPALEAALFRAEIDRCLAAIDRSLSDEPLTADEVEELERALKLPPSTVKAKMLERKIPS